MPKRIRVRVNISLEPSLHSDLRCLLPKLPGNPTLQQVIDDLVFGLLAEYGKRGVNRVSRKKAK